VVALALVPVFVVAAACGGSSSNTKQNRSIGDITVTGGYTRAPKVDFPKPYNVTKTQTKVLQHGPSSGSEVKLNSVITIKFVEYVGRDGGSVGDAAATAIRPWTPSSQPYTFALTSTSTIKGVRTGLIGAKAGQTILFSIAPKDAYDPTGNGTTVSPGDSIVAVVRLISVRNPLTKAAGPSAAAPPTVPTLRVSAKNIPLGFKTSASVPAKVSKLGVYPIIRGSGAKLRAGQTVTVQYLGQIYPAKKIFDQSWTRGQPVSFKLGAGAVIKGWDQGLVGQRIGSRVVLVVPSALGYGKTGQTGTIPKNADLIFSLDILGAY
jgi:peptidylprolyl isomerase